jgi:hypothetical protein
MGIYDATVSPFSGLSAGAPSGQRVVSGKTMAARPVGPIASAVGGRNVSGKTLAQRPGAYANQGDISVMGPTHNATTTSQAIGTDPSRLGGHNSQSAVPFPVYGPANTGDFPNIQRAFASGKEQSGVTQLLPNLPNAPAANGAAQLVTPQLSRVTGGDHGGFTPGEIINIQRESTNQLQQAADTRRQQAMNQQGQTMDQVNNLYQQAAKESRIIGRQAYDRINEQEQKNLSSSQGSLLSRGLGNATISDTIGHLYRQEANDARLGVDESKARLNTGLDTQLADQYSNSGARMEQLLTGGNPTDPSQSAIAQYGESKKSNNIGNMLLPSAGGLIGSAAGGAGSALGSAAGAGIGALGGLIASIF